MENLRIGKFSDLCGVKIDTIRYYEGLGLIQPKGRTQSGYRYYGQECFRRFKFIKKGQSLGFSLEEIRALLNLHASKETTAGDVLKMTKEKLSEQENKINDLKGIMNILKSLIAQCPGEGPTSECPILEYLIPENAVKESLKISRP